MPITSKNFQNNYGFPNPLSSGAPEPIVSNRAPKTNDFADVGTVWVYSANNQSWILVSTLNGTATWNLMESGGSGGAFSTLTSTGATTLATTAASVNTFGNTTGATSVTISVGTGGFTSNGVGGSSYAIGAATTTGSVTIGGTAQSGNFNLGVSSSTQTTNLATGSGAQTINIGTGAGSAKTINIGTGAVANAITIGSASIASLTLSAAGLVQVVPGTTTSSAATAIINKRVGVITYTGFTTAQSASQTFTVSNSFILATSFVQVTVTNLNASTNGAYLTIDGIIQGVGSVAITCTNNGAGALGSGDNVLVSFVVNS